MEIILIDDVFELGKRGDIVTVANGYGRNYLIPKSLAVPATPANRKMVDQQRLAMAKKEAKYQEEAELLAQELNQLHLIISRKSGETGTLFGSVTSKDITDLLQHTGIRLDRRKLVLSQPIKSIGNYRIEVHPHSEVTAELLLSIPIEGEKPISEVKKKNEESDKMVAELEAKIKEMGQLTRGQSSASPQPEDTFSEERESQAAEEQEKEATKGNEAKEAAAEEHTNEEV
ncbi:MAG: 50S ribosomal protein L9 [Acidobacteria bacterium]|nr:50S ribosomal protein L9 [Acidobacteriota bacterium]MCZ6877322.1 50S ribosomal protein L9 [Acidobacteriota bacterium]